MISVQSPPAVATARPAQRNVEFRPRSLRHNTAWTFLGNATYAACQWGMLVALTKIGDPTLVGRFALGLAITAPVFMFANLQLRSVLVTDARREFEFSDYLGLRMLTTVLAVAVVGIIGWAGGYQSETLLAVFAIALVRAIESFNDVCFGLLQRHEQMQQIARAQIAIGVLSVAALMLCLWTTERLTFAILGWAASSLVVLATVSLPSVSRILCLSDESAPASPGTATAWHVMRPRLDLLQLKRLSWLALPLGLVMMVISLNANVPRYVLERRLGEAELGVFASLAYLLVGCSMISVAIGQAAAPRLANLYTRNNLDSFVRLMLKMVAAGAVLGVLGVLATALLGRPLLRLAYTAEYTQFLDVLLWLAVAAGIGLVASSLGFAITAARYFRSQVPLNVAVLAATLVAASLLIPRHGLLGAAWTAVITAIVQLVGSGVTLCCALRVRVRGPHRD